MIKKEMVTLDELASLCKRRGFVYPSSEIYGGFSGIYDYGPVGVELVNNIKSAWWNNMVRMNQNIVGLDSSIFMHPKTWEASGHVGGFSDPLVECRVCGQRSRADHLIEEAGGIADEKMSDEEINLEFDKFRSKIKCPKCGNKDFNQVKSFNLLVKSNLGNFTGNIDDNPSYLRGETCQGIYLNYSNVVNTSRVKIPFGIAQIGKAFRNEISPRQFIFRLRELEQMEMQYFVEPNQEMDEYQKLKQKRWAYYINDLGIKEENIRWKEHENLVFYAKAAYDIEYNFPGGFKELEGIHARGNYDLSQHSKFSGKDLSYFDPATSTKYIPHIIESSVGVSRTMLAILTDSYHKEEIEGEESRVVLKIKPSLAPIKAAILPLMKKADLTCLAEEIFNNLLAGTNLNIDYDDSGSIGKRYRRQDEIGTPFCITIDFQSLEDSTVTIRYRDSMEQKRISTNDLQREVVDNISNN